MIIITICFYLLDLIINYFFSPFSSLLLIPLLILVYPLFSNIKNYFIYIFIISIMFSFNINSVLLNIISFLFIGIFIKNYFVINKYTLLNLNILSVLTFLIYIIILLVVLNLNYYNNPTYLYILKPFYFSLPINLLVLNITYFIMHKRKK